uniref:CDK5 and ABL1 enzyme substrate 2 n=1 Tax=Phallusia mammillata TaxID=59560 RepID=A0A6F9D8C7_9ASCI|nr:CDK5 and ABL1 enzyme substrate 2 [Phallusia mammillata]
MEAEDTVKHALIFLKEIPLSIQQLSNNTAAASNDVSSRNVQENRSDSSLVFSSSTCMQITKLNSHILYKRSVSSFHPAEMEKRHCPENSSNVLEETKILHDKSTLASSLMWKKRASLKKSIVKMKYITNAMLLNCRLLFLEPLNNTPFVLVSVISHQKDKKNNFGSNVYTNKDQYIGPKNLLTSTKTPVTNDELNTSLQSVTSYKSLLDSTNDPPVPIDLNSAEWTTGKHRKVLGLNGYLVSVMEYTKPSELKKTINAKFRCTFPNVGITLSKIRSLEQQMLRVTKQFGLHTGVLGCAVALFKRLIFSGKVVKANRHSVAGTCVLLSSKVHGDLKLEDLSNLFLALEHNFKCDKGDIVKMEFQVFAALEFSLII